MGAEVRISGYAKKIAHGDIKVIISILLVLFSYESLKLRSISCRWCKVDITDVRIVKVDGQPFLKAYVTVTFDDELVVHNIRLVEVDGKIMLSMPNKKIRDGVYKDYVHPINNEFRDRITSQILSQYYNS